MRLVGSLRKVSEDDVSSGAVEIFCKPVSEIFVREMSVPGSDSLFELPSVDRAGPQHVAAVVRFDDDRIAPVEFLLHLCSEAAEVRERCHANSSALCHESEIIHRVVRHAERFKIDIADPKLAR